MRKIVGVFLVGVVLFGFVDVANAQPRELPSPTEEMPPPNIEICYGYPFWSPDGTKIAFRFYKKGAYGPNNGFLYLINPDGTGLQEVPTPDNSEVGSFCWSPDGKEIALTKEFGYYGRSDIYIVNLENRNIRNITKKPGKYSFLDWSPDGTKIAFGNYKDKNREIWIIEVNGEWWFKLADGKGPFAWSPDNKMVAYGLSVIEIDGKNEHNLAQIFSRKISGFPFQGSIFSWSLDNRMVFFSGEKQIWGALVDGSALINFTGFHTEFGDSDPVMLPDRKRIAFIKDGDIWVMDLTRFEKYADPKFFNYTAEVARKLAPPHTRPRRSNLTNTGDIQEYSSFWSPDGKKIVYVRDDEIWIMDSNGANQKQLTFERTKAIEEAKRKQAEEKVAREKALKETLQKK